ncbi:MAG: hypothetical protein MUF20_09295 [Methylotetracoccus sp.]|jgi:hypothetical protein|nr:hypothetical protein [Methylotetracoccus sp.]
MKWLLQSFVLAFWLGYAPASQALCATDGTYGPGDALIDLIVYRPIGLVGTAVGAAGFLALSPFAALASIPPPHDAFGKTSDLLVLTPAAFTFKRPFGDCTEMGYDDW